MEENAGNRNGDAIKSIATDGSGHVWVLTDQYVKEYNPANGSFYLLRNSDKEVRMDYFHSVCRVGDSVCIGGIGAFCMVEPSAELDKAAVLNPKHPAIPYCRGLVAVKRGQNKEALAFFNQALKLDPADPFFYRERAFLHARNGKKEAALDDIKVAAAVSGNAPEFVHARIELYYLLRDIDGLIACTSELLKADEKDVYARVTRAGAYMLKRNYAKAYGDYRKLSEMPLTADIPDVQEGLALVSSHVGRLDEAEKAYEKLLGKNATPITRINLAELYIVRGKYEKALKLLDSDQLLRSADRFMKCISSYLAASALLASGKNAEAPMKVFYELLPQFKEKSEETDWDTALFENWLKNAELPSGAKEKIADMTGRAGETFRVK